MIPEAAVEAAAKIAYRIHAPKYMTMYAEWEDLGERLRKPWLRDAFNTLEAAAPHMLAQFVMEAEQQRMIADYERPTK